MSAVVKWQEMKVSTRIGTIRDRLNGIEDRIGSALGQGVSVKKFIEVAMGAYARGDSKLQRAHPSSVCSSIMQAASLGLSIDPAVGEAYLVTRHNKHVGQEWTTLMIGYRGLLKRVWASKHIDDVAADVVHEGDEFQHMGGTTQRIDHVKDYTRATRPKVLCAYAWARLRKYAVAQPGMGGGPVTTAGGGCVTHISPLYEINEARDRSQGRGQSGPWKTDYAAMAQKTAIRRLVKLLPMDQQLEAVLATEDLLSSTNADSFQPEGMDGDVLTTVEQGPPETLSDLAANAERPEPPREGPDQGPPDDGENPFLS